MISTNMTPLLGMVVRWPSLRTLRTVQQQQHLVKCSWPGFQLYQPGGHLVTLVHLGDQPFGHTCILIDFN